MFLVKLFEVEVPEIQDGTIVIKSAAREPGFRAKIAVMSADKEIDPVGACVGMKGSRVQNIVNELQGEKIDIVRWSEEMVVFCRAALAPADISNIMIDNENKSMDVVVEEDQLALAIGRRGQNVRLAAMLSGFNINIISKVKLQEKIAAATENLKQIENLSEAHAQVLVQSGVMSISDLVGMTAEEVAQLLGVTASASAEIIEKAKEDIDTGKITLSTEEDEEFVSASATPAYNGILRGGEGSSSEDGDEKFSEAEKRLREELAAFKIK